jgi:hypothetical protein
MKALEDDQDSEFDPNESVNSSRYNNSIRMTPDNLARIPQERLQSNRLIPGVMRHGSNRSV